MWRIAHHPSCLCTHTFKQMSLDVTNVSNDFYNSYSCSHNTVFWKTLVLYGLFRLSKWMDQSQKSGFSILSQRNNYKQQKHLTMAKLMLAKTKTLFFYLQCLSHAIGSRWTHRLIRRNETWALGCVIRTIRYWSYIAWSVGRPMLRDN